MDSKQLLGELWEDFKCPICLETMKQPVTTNCGHNFCLHCISEIGEASDNFFLCPLCKSSVKRTFQLNKLLGSVVEKIQVIDKEDSDLRYWRPNEKSLHFCEDHKKFLCSVCFDPKDPKFHNVNLTEEAAQNYQEQIQAQPPVLGQKEKEAVEQKKQVEVTTDAFKEQIQAQPQVLVQNKEVVEEKKQGEGMMGGFKSWFQVFWPDKEVLEEKKQGKGNKDAFKDQIQAQPQVVQKKEVVEGKKQGEGRTDACKDQIQAQPQVLQKDNEVVEKKQDERTTDACKEQIQAQPQVLQKDKEVVEEKKQGEGTTDACKEQIQAQPQVVRKKYKEVVEEKKQGEGTTDACKAQVHQEILKIQEEFSYMKKKLEKKESFHLSRWKLMEEEKRFLLARWKQMDAEMCFLLARWENLDKEENLCLGCLPCQEQEEDKSKDMDPSSRDQELPFTIPTSVPVDLEDRNSKEISISLEERKKKDKKKKAKNLPWHSLKAKKMNSWSSLFEKNKGSYLSGESKEVLSTSAVEERNKNDKKKKDKRLSWNSLKAEKMDSCSGLSGENKGLVTLNAASADPELTLSQDLKTVSLQPFRGGAKNNQAKPRPFDHYHWVLGSQGLSSGRLVWEVMLQGTDKGECVVGVATELVPGQHSLKHIWALRVSGWECQPITESSAHENFPLLLRKVGICLDHDFRKVIFFNPTTEEQIYIFQESFTGEVFPFFGLLHPGSQISLIP